MVAKDFHENWFENILGSFDFRNRVEAEVNYSRDYLTAVQLQIIILLLFNFSNY